MIYAIQESFISDRMNKSEINIYYQQIDEPKSFSNSLPEDYEPPKK